MENDKQVKAALFLEALTSLGGSFTPVLVDKTDVYKPKTGRRATESLLRPLSQHESDQYVISETGTIRRKFAKSSKRKTKQNA